MKWEYKVEDHRGGGHAMKCPVCDGSIVLRWKSQYTARLECHGCWLNWNIGIDPCYKEEGVDRP
jgi:hypothetical protein